LWCGRLACTENVETPGFVTDEASRSG